MTQELVQKQISAIELINSLSNSIENDEVSFEFKNNWPDGVLDFYWFYDDQDEVDLHLTANSYFEFIHDENGETVDIESIRVVSIEIGDGLDMEAITVSGLNEHALAPLFTRCFDKFNETARDDETQYALNLVSESPSKRGSNWVTVNQPSIA